MGDRQFGLVVDGLEHIFARAAFGADPIVGKLVEIGAGLYAVIGIAKGGVVNIVANRAFVFSHRKGPFLILCSIHSS